MITKIRIINQVEVPKFYFIWMIWMSLSLPSYCQESAQHSIRILNWNVENYNILNNNFGRTKPIRSRELIAQTIDKLTPNIVLLQEIGNKQSLNDLRSRLVRRESKLTHQFMTSSNVSPLQLAILSDRPFKTIKFYDQLSFIHLSQMRKVRRGLLHAVVEISSDREVHVFNMHLKSKRVVPHLDEEIFRIQESTEIRKLMSSIMKAYPDAIFVVAGDMNDFAHSKTMKIMRGHGATRLWDLAPAEPGQVISHPRKTTWTHYFEGKDTYSRIDYFLVGTHVRPFVNRENTFVYDDNIWGDASDHRPLILTLSF